MVTGTLFATQLIEYKVTSGSNTLKSVLKRTILPIFPSRLSRTSVRSFLLSCCCRLESRALGVLASRCRSETCFFLSSSRSPSHVLASFPIPIMFFLVCGPFSRGSLGCYCVSSCVSNYFVHLGAVALSLALFFVLLPHFVSFLF